MYCSGINLNEYTTGVKQNRAGKSADQSIAISLKKTLSTASVNETPNKNKHNKVSIGKIKRLTQANSNPKKTRITINGISENKKLIRPDIRVDIGKIIGDTFNDISIPLLDTIDVNI